MTANSVCVLTVLKCTFMQLFFFTALNHDIFTTSIFFSRNAPRGATALMAASRRGHSRVVELLLQVEGIIRSTLGIYSLTPSRQENFTPDFDNNSFWMEKYYYVFFNDLKNIIYVERTPGFPGPLANYSKKNFSF